MISIDGAALRYESETALQNLTLQVQPGEMLSIIGPSGCGKTSLLYAVAGLRELTRGSIQIDREALPCGLLFQDDRLLPWLTATENITLGIRTTPDMNSAQQARQLMQTLNISEQADKFPAQLSGGQRQRVALARMLIRRPRLLLLDEPFASLDEQTRELLQNELLQYIRQHAMTMLLVTHSIAEAVYLGKRIVVMKKASIHSELANPVHPDPTARDHADFYTMVRELRRRLQSAAEAV